MSNTKFHPWCIILAAGFGTRLSPYTDGLPKQFLSYNNYPLYLHSARSFAKQAELKGLIFVFPEEYLHKEIELLQDMEKTSSLQIEWKAVTGGERRQDSVACGLKALPPQCTHVLIHDAARPFVSPKLIQAVLQKLQTGAMGVIPALPVVDTIKEISNGIVKNTPDRKTLFNIQTPQGFELDTLKEVHGRIIHEDCTVTDDASLLEKYGHHVYIVEGEAQNIKITHENDLMKLQKEKSPRPCVGFGYDVHRFAQKDEQTKKIRPLKLGGVHIDGKYSIIAHSDGDVLLHALMDALLGAASLGDIGLHFPDTSPIYDNMDSAVLLQEVLRLVKERNLQINHVDTTIITQKPKIAPQRNAIQKSLAHLLSLPLSHINVKATTEEGLGFTGEGAGIKAVAIVQGYIF